MVYTNRFKRSHYCFMMSTKGHILCLLETVANVVPEPLHLAELSVTSRHLTFSGECCPSCPPDQPQVDCLSLRHYPALPGGVLCVWGGAGSGGGSAGQGAYCGPQDHEVEQ